MGGKNRWVTLASEKRKSTIEIIKSIRNVKPLVKVLLIKPSLFYSPIVGVDNQERGGNNGEHYHLCRQFHKMRG